MELGVEQEPELPWDSGLKGLTALSSLTGNEAGSTRGKDFVPYPKRNRSHCSADGSQAS